MNAPRKTTRRQFLGGQSAADALADWVVGPEPAEASDAPWATSVADDAYLMQITRRAMACEFAVYLSAGEHGEQTASPSSNAAEAAVEALDLVQQLEEQMTVYCEHSELCKINRTAAAGPIVVEPRLFGLLQQSLELFHATDGAFDVSAGPLAKAWGFFRRAGRLPDDDELREAIACVGSQWLELDQARQTVRFLKSGVEINLGGIGKGFAIDRCVELLCQRGVENFLIHGGQSSVAARGDRLATAESQSMGWRVGVRHPLRPQRRVAEVRLKNRALGTSGTSAQSFYHQGRRYGHILDPRSGRPAEGVLSSTVLAPTAALADALATAFYVMGVEPSLQFCQTRDDLAAILLSPGGRDGTICVDSIGLDDDDWRCFDA